MTVYKNGDSGEAVRRIQLELNAAGFPTGTPDGIYGPDTEAAVRAFQQSRGLDVDGVVGPRTWGALQGADVASPPAPSAAPAPSDAPPTSAAAAPGVYRIGDRGEEVRTIQTELKSAGFDPGPIDGVYGGGTAAAVRAFQTSKGLPADGVVGPVTWAALSADASARGSASLPEAAPPPTPVTTGAYPLDERCLALTGSIETSLPVPDCFGGLSGNFDGMGMSFGALQWNFGQGSLQPMLTRMVGAYPDVSRTVFGEFLGELTTMLAEPDRSAQVEWAVSKQNPRNQVLQPWNGMFKALGRTAEYRGIETDTASGIYQKGLGYCRQFGLKSERAAALMFDIVTQNGSISSTVAAQINADFAQLPPDSGEEPKLVIVARRRAEASDPRWVQDVLTRKMMIATGSGTVHGMTYDLASQYGITMALVPGL